MAHINVPDNLPGVLGDVERQPLVLPGFGLS
jgi:hypothetical protein